MSDTLDHVHVTHEGVSSVEMTPPHPPREETSAYRKSHEYLVDKQDKPCQCCGVRKSTLHKPAQNPYGATQVETHHFPIERSLMYACDPDKVHNAYPQVIDLASLEAFVDSPANLIVLCDICHRGHNRGIHHLLPQDFFIQPFLYTGYCVVASCNDAQAAQRADEQIMKGI